MTNNIVVADAFNGVVRPLAEGDRFVVTLPVQLAAADEVHRAWPLGRKLRRCLSASGGFSPD